MSVSRIIKVCIGFVLALSFCTIPVIAQGPAVKGKQVKRPSDPRVAEAIYRFSVSPRFVCEGDSVTFRYDATDVPLEKILVRDRRGQVIKEFKEFGLVNWKTPELSASQLPLRAEIHVAAHDSFAAEVKRVELPIQLIDEPKWTKKFNSVYFKHETRVERRKELCGGYFEDIWCTNWKEVCEPKYTCADECDEDWNCDYVCHEVGEDCWSEPEDYVCDSVWVDQYCEKLDVTLLIKSVHWNRPPNRFFSRRVEVRQILNLNDYSLKAQWGSAWNTTIPPYAGSTPMPSGIRPSALDLWSDFSPPMSRYVGEFETEREIPSPSRFYSGIAQGYRLQLACPD